MNTTEYHTAMQMNKPWVACNNTDKFHKLIKQKKQEEKECKWMSSYKIKKQN